MDIEPSTIAVVVCVMLAVGAAFYATVYPYLSGEVKAEKRQAALAQPKARKTTDRGTDPAARRKQVADSLRELEGKGKKKRASLEERIGQAGLNLTRSHFILASAGAAIVVGLLILVTNDNPFIAPVGAIVAGLGLPNWMLSYLRNKRIKKFTEEMPNAVDIIIRGVKAGLPLGDCLRIIATESSEPVLSVFRDVVDAQSMGLSISEAVDRIPARVPTPEASFFAIVINIQQKAGGNLSDALANLSRVLRERKKMRAKVQAMSSEAKASASIIGALPFAVGGLVYITSPRYIELLWTTTTGRMVLVGCAIWMAIGIMSMKKMINFDI